MIASLSMTVDCMARAKAEAPEASRRVFRVVEIMRHDGEAATVEQFVQCFADVSGKDLAQFMLWYSQAGTPEVVATGSYDAQSKSYHLDLTQSVPATPGQPTKQPMTVPAGTEGCTASRCGDEHIRLTGVKSA